MIRAILVISICIFIGFSCKHNNPVQRTVKSDKEKIKLILSPKDYQLVKIDTTINDSIRLVVDRYTLDTYVTPYPPDSFDLSMYAYRDYALKVSLSINDSQIVEKQYLKNSFELKKDFLDLSIIYGVWFKSFDPFSKTFKLVVGVGVEDSDNVEQFNMTIHLNGDIKLDIIPYDEG